MFPLQLTFGALSARFAARDSAFAQRHFHAFAYADHSRATHLPRELALVERQRHFALSSVSITDAARAREALLEYPGSSSPRMGAADAAWRLPRVADARCRAGPARSPAETIRLSAFSARRDSRKLSRSPRLMKVASGEASTIRGKSARAPHVGDILGDARRRHDLARCVAHRKPRIAHPADRAAGRTTRYCSS